MIDITTYKNTIYSSNIDERTKEIIMHLLDVATTESLPVILTKIDKLINEKIDEGNKDLEELDEYIEVLKEIENLHNKANGDINKQEEVVVNENTENQVQDVVETPSSTVPVLEENIMSQPQVQEEVIQDIPATQPTQEVNVVDTLPIQPSVDNSTQVLDQTSIEQPVQDTNTQSVIQSAQQSAIEDEEKLKKLKEELDSLRQQLPQNNIYDDPQVSN